MRRKNRFRKINMFLPFTVNFAFFYYVTPFNQTDTFIIIIITTKYVHMRQTTTHPLCDYLVCNCNKQLEKSIIITGFDKKKRNSGTQQQECNFISFSENFKSFYPHFLRHFYHQVEPLQRNCSHLCFFPLPFTHSHTIYTFIQTHFSWIYYLKSGT